MVKIQCTSVILRHLVHHHTTHCRMMRRLHTDVFLSFIIILPFSLFLTPEGAQRYGVHGAIAMEPSTCRQAETYGNSSNISCAEVYVVEDVRVFRWSDELTITPVARLRDVQYREALTCLCFRSTSRKNDHAVLLSFLPSFLQCVLPLFSRRSRQ